MATVEEIKELWAHVDALEKQTEELVKELEASRWKLAEWLYDASEAGATQRPLAKKVGKSQSLVSHYTTLWRNHKDQPDAERPPFGQLPNAPKAPTGEYDFLASERLPVLVESLRRSPSYKSPSYKSLITVVIGCPSPSQSPSPRSEKPWRRWTR